MNADVMGIKVEGTPEEIAKVVALVSKRNNPDEKAHVNFRRIPDGIEWFPGCGYAAPLRHM